VVVQELNWSGTAVGIWYVLPDSSSFCGGADRHDSLIATIAKLQTPLGITRYVWPKGSIAFSMSDKRSFLSVAIGAPLRQ